MRARQQLYLIEPLGETDDGEHAVYRQEHLKINGTPGGAHPDDTRMLYDVDQDPDPQLAGLFRSKSWVRVTEILQ